MAAALNPHEDLVDLEGVAVASVTEIQAIVGPDRLGRTIWGKEVGFLSVHPLVQAIFCRANLSFPAGLKLHFIQPDKPTQSVSVESFNSELHEYC